tara:strand:+ start:1285 stop:2100 length:816 start_codon:yes stop_codon:yes gene_type:complete
MSLPSVKGTFKSVNKSSLDRVMGHVTRPGGVGILSPSRFDVYIGGAASGIITDVASRQNATRQTLSVEALRRLSESCESVNFPGRSLSSQPNRISGPVREMPYESLYSGDLDITFRVGGDMFERQYFEEWMDIIVDHKTNRLNYYDNYVRDIYLSQLNIKDQIVHQVIVKECYPKTLNPIERSQASTDETLKQSLSFAFREYEVIDTTISPDLMFQIRNAKAIREQREQVEKEVAAAQREIIDFQLQESLSAAGLIPPPAGPDPFNTSFKF